MVAKNTLAAQNTTASKIICLSLLKIIQLRINVLREPREEFDVLASPLLNGCELIQ
jgi:hypothetical protein